MDFSYTEVQQMLQDSVQKFVQKSYDFDTRNKIISSEAGYSADNWQLFEELGWERHNYRDGTPRSLFWIDVGELQAQDVQRRLRWPGMRMRSLALGGRRGS